MPAHRAGDDGPPLRLLDNFSLAGGKRGTQLMGFDAISSGCETASLLFRGTLLPVSGRKRGGALQTCADSFTGPDD